MATLQHKGMAEIPDGIADVVKERDIQVIVVGLPLDARGEVGVQAKKVMVVCAALEKKFVDCRVDTVDESHSSDVAHAWLKEAGVKAARRKKHVDSLAAVEILRRWLGD